jgi:hypothetical protein
MMGLACATLMMAGLFGLTLHQRSGAITARPVLAHAAPDAG